MKDTEKQLSKLIYKRQVLEKKMKGASTLDKLKFSTKINQLNLQINSLKETN